MGTSMQVEERTFLKRLDFNLIFVILALNIVGLVNLYSATHGAHSSDTRQFFLQLIWLAAGWVIFFTVTFIDYKFFIKAAYVFFAANLVALVLVKVIGKSFYGAQRWIDLGFFRYQPSETVKIAIILVLARVLPNLTKPDGMTAKDLSIPLAITIPPVLLTVTQPDLGTGILIAAITGAMLLFVKVKRKIIIIGTIAVLLLGGWMWQYGLKEYQRNRVETFLDPGKDPRGAGYNSIQSKIAIGSGRYLGKGFRKGTQSQLEFLPERHTDFIFSVLSEEHGFLGSVLTVGLFSVLFFMGLHIAGQAQDRIGMILTVGVLAYLFWHMFINICMVTGLMPIVGVPLPLLSYGGSGMISTMFGLGLISSVSYRRYLF